LWPNILRPCPGFIKPQLATLKATAQKGDQWLHEIKYDGYRVQLHLNNGKKKVYTRSGRLDWTKRFSVFAGDRWLQRPTARGGRESIDHAPGAHDDVANAVAGVVDTLTAGKSRYYNSMPWVSGPTTTDLQ
jgi:hypothetical protein